MGTMRHKRCIATHKAKTLKRQSSKKLDLKDSVNVLTFSSTFPKKGLTHAKPPIDDLQLYLMTPNKGKRITRSSINKGKRITRSSSNKKKSHANGLPHALPPIDDLQLCFMAPNKRKQTTHSSSNKKKSLSDGLPNALPPIDDLQLCLNTPNKHKRFTRSSINKSKKIISSSGNKKNFDGLPHTKPPIDNLQLCLNTPNIGKRITRSSINKGQRIACSYSSKKKSPAYGNRKTNKSTDSSINADSPVAEKDSSESNDNTSIKLSSMKVDNHSNSGKSLCRQSQRNSRKMSLLVSEVKKQSSNIQDTNSKTAMKSALGNKSYLNCDAQGIRSKSARKSTLGNKLDLLNDVQDPKSKTARKSALSNKSEIARKSALDKSDLICDAQGTKSRRNKKSSSGNKSDLIYYSQDTKSKRCISSTLGNRSDLISDAGDISSPVKQTCKTTGSVTSRKSKQKSAAGENNVDNTNETALSLPVSQRGSMTVDKFMLNTKRRKARNTGNKGKASSISKRKNILIPASNRNSVGLDDLTVTVFPTDKFKVNTNRRKAKSTSISQPDRSLTNIKLQRRHTATGNKGKVTHMNKRKNILISASDRNNVGLDDLTVTVFSTPNSARRTLAELPILTSTPNLGEKIVFQEPKKKSVTVNGMPKKGTLKRKRWMIEELKGRNEGYEDDIFDSHEYEGIKKILPWENISNMSLLSVATPKCGAFLATPIGHVKTPHFKDSYSPMELLKARKVAEEVMHRRNKTRKSGSGVEGTCFNQPSTSNSAAVEPASADLPEKKRLEFMSLIKSLPKAPQETEHESDEDVYFSDEESPL